MFLDWMKAVEERDATEETRLALQFGARIIGQCLGLFTKT